MCHLHPQPPYSIPERSPLVSSVLAHAFNSTQRQRQKDSSSGKLPANAELSSFLQNSPGSFSAAVTINCKSHGSVQEVTAMSERGAEDSLHQDSQERNSKASRASDNKHAHPAAVSPWAQVEEALSVELSASLKLVTMTVTRKHSGFCS